MTLADDLKAEVAHEKADVDAVKTKLADLAAQVADLTQKLNDALANGDLVAVQEALDAFKAANADFDTVVSS